MGNKVHFKPLYRPTKAKAGRTDVFNLETRNGVTNDVQIGTLTKVRGSEGYEAFVIGADDARVKLDGTFATRSQAGHKVLAAFYADERAAKVAKAAARVTAAEAKKAARIAAKAAKAIDVAIVTTDGEAVASDGETAATDEQAA